MPISRLLQNSAFDQTQIDALVEAFNRVCRELELDDESDPLRELVARKIIEFAENGTTDPLLLRAFAASHLEGMVQRRQDRKAAERSDDGGR